MSDSLELYRGILSYVRTNLIQNPNPQMKTSYSQIVLTMLQELVSKQTSPLLSAFCGQFNTDIMQNIKIEPKTGRVNIYDLTNIIACVNLAFTENINKMAERYDQIKQDIFFNRSFASDDYKEYLLSQLKMLDENVGRFIPKKVETPIQKQSYFQTQSQTQIEDTPRAYDSKFTDQLNKIAGSRKSRDESIDSEIQKLQLNFQNEIQSIQQSLSQISSIREGISYSTLEEPINQMLSLFGNVDDILKNHPREDSNGYQDLVDECQHFLGYIEQSLAMLGVELINQTDINFDASKHKSISRGITPSRSSIVKKIQRIGFIYKGNVLEKAEVEISNPVQAISRGGFFRQ